MRRRVVRRFGSDALRRAARLAIVIAFIGLVASFVVRGDAAGADFAVYWTAARTWLAGGDPYRLPDGVMPYLYAPWGLPLFVPWALLPWDAAFIAWRAVTLLALLGSLAWAAARRPLATGVLFMALAIPIGINLDTGNVTLPLALAIFGARFAPPWLTGLTWGIATGLKLATAPLILVFDAAERRAGLATLAVAVTLSLALWPMTLDQMRTIAAHDRPIPIDYLVLVWATVPWFWTDPRRRRWLRPQIWRRRLSPARTN